MNGMGVFWSWKTGGWREGGRGLLEVKKQLHQEVNVTIAMFAFPPFMEAASHTPSSHDQSHDSKYLHITAHDIRYYNKMT